MAFEPKQLMSDHIASMEVALKAAYEQGVRDGIERIIAAATAPLSQNDARTVQGVGHMRAISSASAKGEVIRRAPRGLVPEVVGRMLSERPGKIVAEYEQIVDEYDSRVSTKSIGNELRRHEGRKYYRNDSGEWFPMSGNKEAGDGQQTNSPASDVQTQGEHYGTALDL